MDSPQDLNCSFCAKPQAKVAKLISSPDHEPRAYICDACIAVCNRILAESERPAEPPRTRLRRWLSQWFLRGTYAS